MHCSSLPICGLVRVRFLLCGSLKDFSCSPVLGEMIQFDQSCFSNWLERRTSFLLKCLTLLDSFGTSNSCNKQIIHSSLKVISFVRSFFCLKGFSHITLHIEIFANPCVSWNKNRCKESNSKTRCKSAQQYRKVEDPPKNKTLKLL